jgi:hypothetical protein
MVLGAVAMGFVVAVFGALHLGVAESMDFFKETNSPELTPKSQKGMARCFVAGFVWFAAGRLIWKRRFATGLIIAFLVVPFGVTGAKWMFSSPPRPPASGPTNSAPMMRPQFDNFRRKPPPPPLAQRRDSIQTTIC